MQFSSLATRWRQWLTRAVPVFGIKTAEEEEEAVSSLQASPASSLTGFQSVLDCGGLWLFFGD